MTKLKTGVFWPGGLDILDVQSPVDILEVAQEDWRMSGGGEMELAFQNATNESGSPMVIVCAKHVPSNRTATLFYVVSHSDDAYPVTIETSPGIPLSLELNGPAEFRERLSRSFNADAIKTVIINL